jgi:nitrite reductase (NADH) large subunit
MDCASFLLARQSPFSQRKDMKWVCKICGYEHEGDSPPDECPVCGAGPEEFERVDAPVAAEADLGKSGASANPGELRCSLCDAPWQQVPVACLRCGAKLGRVVGAPASAQRSTGGARYVVAGGGVAGWTAAERLRALDPGASITLLTREPSVPYYRLSLTRFLGGEIQPADLIVHAPSWWAQHNIDVALECEVLQLDRSGKSVVTDRGVFAYDRLVVATGARAFLPPLKNAMVHGVTALRTLSDARFVTREAREGDDIAIVGGGVLGLETAFALARRGCRVTVCEGAPQLLSRQLDVSAASMFQQHLEKKGIRFVLGDLPSEVVGDETARALKLASGAEVPARIVIVSAGVRPNTLVWQQAGLRVQRGLVVDGTMRTSDPDVFAAGDVAEHEGVVYGIWPAALEMGRVAGANAAGKSEVFGGLPMSHTLKVVDLDVFSIGATRADRDGMTEFVRPIEPPSYAKIVLDQGVVAGAILMGDTSLSGRMRQWVLDKRDLSGFIAAKVSPAELFAKLEAP